MIAPSDSAKIEDARPARSRLSWLAGGRLVVATVLLGLTLLVTASDRSDFEAFTPRSLTWLIAATYAATAAFAGWMSRARDLRLVAVAQLAWDVMLTSGLCYLSGGAASIFTFLYGVTILMAAIVVGPGAARLTGAASVFAYVTIGLGLTRGFLPIPPDQDPQQYHIADADLAFALLSNIVGLTLVAILADNLAGRLRRAGGELRKAEQSAATLARLNDDIVRSIGSGLVTTDLEGRVRTINPAGSEMFGASADELAGRALSELMPIELGVGAQDGGGSRRGEGIAKRPDGTAFPIGFTATPLASADGDVFGSLVTFTDLTEVQNLRAEKERAERLAALGRLAAGLAHEIRNPLSSISGSVELVRDASTLGEEDRRLLGIVLSEVERLDDLVTTMLHVGRPRPPSLGTADLGKLVDDVVAMARRGPASAAQVAIEWQAPPAPVQARIDAGQMRQVLWNLIKNAIQASSAGAVVRVGVRAEGDRAVVEVADHGAGIAPEQRDRLFDMFYSGREHGVGLGLALVKQIVDGHGGRVDVESEPGRGSTFRVELDAAA